MLIDRHRAAALIALTKVPEAERADHQDALEALLVHLYTHATPAAREAFLKRMDPLPQTEKPWGALTRPSPAQWIGLGPPVPAVLTLLLGQQDDDPDSAEDGNRLPDRDSKEGAPWAPLYVALDRWDTAVIQRHVGPAGWQVVSVQSTPRDEGLAVEFPPRTATLESPPQPTPTTSAASAPVVPPPVSNSPSVSTPLWRRPAVLAGGLTALTLGGLALYAFGRSQSPASPPPAETP